MSAPPAPVELTFRDMVHDAMEGVSEARRAIGNIHVALHEAKPLAAMKEVAILYGELERTFGWLIKLDLGLPEEGGAS